MAASVTSCSLLELPEGKGWVAAMWCAWTEAISACHALK